MLYSAFAILCNHWFPWVYLIYVWSWVFVGRMLLKENSLRKKEGWNEYSQQSYFFIPKVGPNFISTWMFYFPLFGILYLLWIGGGLEGFLKDWKGIID